MLDTTYSRSIAPSEVDWRSNFRQKVLSSLIYKISAEPRQDSYAKTSGLPGKCAQKYFGSVPKFVENVP